MSEPSTTPILLLGAGRMGGALIEGWLRAGAFDLPDLIIRDPHPSDAATSALAGGALEGTLEVVGRARTVLMAVKPQIWREAAAQIQAHLAPDAVIVSIAAGVTAADIAAGFGGRRVARVMPTTAVAIGKGVASIAAHDPEGLARAHALFDPVATTVDLPDEAMMHAATAVSGSAPAYFYALVEALEAAGEAVGLPADASRRLARATMIGAAALMAGSGEDPAELRRQVTSPGGTTAAALAVLNAEAGGLGPLMRETVMACVRRSEELGG